MENKSLLQIFLVVWATYVIGVHLYRCYHKCNLWSVWGLLAVPTVIAILMTVIFLIRGGNTVAQFSAGSQVGMDMWSTWVELWLLLSMVGGMNVLIQMGWTVVAIWKRTRPQWLILAVAPLAVSVFALLAVFFNYPTA